MVTLKTKRTADEVDAFFVQNGYFDFIGNVSRIESGDKVLLETAEGCVYYADVQDVYAHNKATLALW